MSLTPEDVKRILELVQESTFEEFQLELGDLKLVVSKHGRIAQSGSQVPLAPAAPLAVSSPVAPQALAAAPISIEVPQAAPAAPASGVEAGLVEIKSPIVGIFYVASDPDAPPFAAPGAEITEDSTVGVVEVMKVFNAVKSGVRGTVVKRLVDNAEFVEFGQPLFLVRPGAR